MLRLMKRLAEIGKGRVQGSYIPSDRYDEMKDYAENRISQNDYVHRQRYDILDNNCGTFACDVARQDPLIKSDMPWIIDPRPNSMILELQAVFEDINYTPGSGLDYVPTPDPKPDPKPDPEPLPTPEPDPDRA